MLVNEMLVNEVRAGAKIGFIGLGKMGGPMSRRLAEAGYRVRGYDVSEASLRSATERVPGAVAAASPAAAADDAAALVLMLPDSAVVTSVLEDVLPAIRPGASPWTSRSPRARRHGCRPPPPSYGPRPRTTFPPAPTTPRSRAGSTRG